MNKYSINLFWSDEDDGYIATSPEFSGLSAFGETPEEAIREAKIALRLFIDEYHAKGLSLPEPQVMQRYSGQTRLRLSRTLHRQAAQLADSEGISLNRLIEDALIAKVTGTQVAQQALSQIRALLVTHNTDSLIQAWPQSTIKEKTVTTKTEQTFLVPELKFYERGN